MEEADFNLPALGACVDVATSVSKVQVTQSSHATRTASKRKRSIACSAIEVSVQCAPEMVDEACQTDPLPALTQRIIPVMPLRDLCRAVQHDHSYSAVNSLPEGESRDAPVFLVSEPVCAEFEESDSEESDASDSDSDYCIDDENFISEDSDCDDPVAKQEDSDELQQENQNWLKENCGDIHEEKKFVVFESKLKELFSRYVICPNCGNNVNKATITTKGSLATIESHCCFKPVHWQTQPFISSMAAGNLLLSAGILFTGNSYSNFANVAKATNLQFFSDRNFTSTQKKYLFPVVNKVYSEHEEAILDEVRNKQVVAGGDGRCDSPGHSAKYGTYSIVDTDTSKVIDFSLVQVTEVKNSNGMELEGLKRCLDHLQEERVVISKLATDRHVQVRAHMKKERSQIKHNFDVWHMAKSVQKKLTKKAQAKHCAELKPWIQAVITHLWWCAKTSNGNGRECVERWKSIIYHTANVHHWDGCQTFHECAHPPIPPETERRKRWLRIGSPAHDALKEVVWNKSLLKDIEMLAEFIHTGVLEMYHGLMAKKYCHKLQHYSYHGMRARTQLAILDHNQNAGRSQAQTKDGSLKHKFVCPKGTGGWVAKPKYEDKSYQFLDDLMATLVAFKRGDTEVPPLPPKPAGRNIAPITRPPKEELLAKQRSRFNKNN